MTPVDSTAEFSTQFEKATYARVTRRNMPFLFVCYVLAYVDRVNVGFAKLQMQQDLGMSDTVFGFGAGIFFIGYFFFEVPANMILERLGARRWLGPIMVVWGVVSATTMFVTSAGTFYTLRFLLGVVECGFFPGVILYLTYWYTRKHRARMVALFMSAIPLSGVIASPVSGWILTQMTGVGHLRAWQWLFLLEGIPSALAGVVTLFFLTDKPEQAKWLSTDQKNLLRRRLQEEEDAKKGVGDSRYTLADAFRSGKVWLLCLVYFGMSMGNYGLGFWLPQTVKDSLTADPWLIGWISVIPWGLGAISMMLYGRHSDSTGERRWHVALAIIAAAAGFTLSSLPGLPGPAAFAATTLALMGIMCGLCTFWSLPTAILSGAAAAAGIAWINSVGNLAGQAGPYVVGYVRDATGSSRIALLVLAAAGLISGLVTLVVAKPRKA